MGLDSTSEQSVWSQETNIMFSHVVSNPSVRVEVVTPAQYLPCTS